MNVQELMDALAKYDRNTPVKITSVSATEQFQCEECGEWQFPARVDYWATPVDISRYPCGSGQKLTVVIEVREEE